MHSARAALRLRGAASGHHHPNLPPLPPQLKQRPRVHTSACRCCTSPSRRPTAAYSTTRSSVAPPPPSTANHASTTTPATSPRRYLATSSSQRAVPLPSASPASYATSDGEADAKQLRAIFDSPKPSHPVDLLHPTGLFQSASLTSPQHLLDLARRTLLRAQLLVSRIVSAPQHGEEEMKKVVRHLDRLSDLLCGVIDAAELIRNTHPDKNWAAAANETYEMLCGYMNVLNTHTGLYEVLSKVLSTPELSASLSPEARSVALTFLRDFEKSGIHLPGPSRAKFVELSDEILVLARNFLHYSSSPGESKDEEGMVGIPVDWMKGMPSNVLANIKFSSLGPERKTGRLRMRRESWQTQSIARMAPDERARKAAYIALNNGSRGQVEVLETLLRKRAELAELVGNSSFAEMALGDKMARKPENVDSFLRAVARRQRPHAEKVLDKLRALKRDVQGGSTLPPFYAWDRDYFADRYMRSVAHRSTTAPISPFFSVGTVVAGLSRVFSRLFGIRLRAVAVQKGEVCASDVVKLEVVEERADASQPAVVGTIYADVYARRGKPPSAAHYTVRCSRRTDQDDAAGDFVYGRLDDGTRLDGEEGVRLAEPLQVPTTTMAATASGAPGEYQLPIVVLTCDFVRPTASDGPTLLNWSEVETLFHEMGHALHSMIGRTEFHNVSGTRCATDFVELPSILMEHFLTSPEVIALVARHHATDKALPYEHLAAHLAAARSLEALDTHHQILLACLDQVYHSARARDADFDSTRELQAVHDAPGLGLIAGVEGLRWQTRFGHLCGYGATYYSYLFDRAIASRVFSRLFARDALDPEQGRRYKDGVLRHGGGRDPWEMLARLLDEEKLARGDQAAMLEVGSWGIVDTQASHA